MEKINLLGNALKFTTVGSINLKIKKTAEGFYKFEIIDTGTGI